MNIDDVYRGQEHMIAVLGELVTLAEKTNALLTKLLEPKASGLVEALRDLTVEVHAVRKEVADVHGLVLHR